ncbi:sigma-54 interaction domain-containing protein [Janthinobacterium sp. J1-1]|uniref:sigma-54 interaction domain-containing protein n=1 Tax=unclassified Janthinobacterium TaxID=2610881 RepID=UPI0028112330|nr:sigma-54 dependent transcriptional regulator [Janthinobacterium sp. J1-1]
MSVLLTLPTSSGAALSIRAKALVFNDPRSEALLALATHIAPTDATALIIGETGTGKELLARYLHTHSKRSGPFIAVNCGAFSETLIDAELFGHEAGAFTGATQARQGWFEAANGGTLFLDEIGDLPLSMQVKLLRVIQERQIVRLGSRRTTPLDVRLVAATNIDLYDAVQAGRFRADLYYRLGVATLALPPLYARQGDILPLAQHFMKYYAERLKIADIVIDEAARQVLLDYGWPGNIRELENTIHYAMIVCRDGVLRAEDLRLGRQPAATRALAQVHPLPLREPETHIPVPVQEVVEPVEAGLQQQLRTILEALLDAGEDAAFDQIEAAVTGAALAIAHNNQTQTARLLGISRNVLRTLLKRHHFSGGEQEAGEACTA